ncbi:hypothetical protein DJ71_13050 [Halorubrum sp. E3]|nr:hypothetical protein DJ71_13050 [Halorubrum sp. E3]
MPAQSVPRGAWTFVWVKETPLKNGRWYTTDVYEQGDEIPRDLAENILEYGTGGDGIAILDSDGDLIDGYGALRLERDDDRERVEDVLADREVS